MIYFQPEQHSWLVGWWCCDCLQSPMRALLLVIVGLLAFQVGNAKGGAIECELCHFIVKEIDSLLESHAVHSFIEKEVNKTCNLAIFQKYSSVVRPIRAYVIFFCPKMKKPRSEQAFVDRTELLNFKTKSRGFPFESTYILLYSKKSSLVENNDH